MVVNFVFGYHGCGRVLRDHETVIEAALFYQECRKSLGQCRVDQSLGSSFRYVGQFGDGDLQEVKGKRHRLSMEIAAGDDFIFVREYDRIVGHGIDLSGYRSVCIGDGISGCTVDLRQASL